MAEDSRGNPSLEEKTFLVFNLCKLVPNIFEHGVPLLMGFCPPPTVLTLHIPKTVFNSSSIVSILSKLLALHFLRTTYQLAIKTRWWTAVYGLFAAVRYTLNTERFHPVSVVLASLDEYCELNLKLCILRQNNLIKTNLCRTELFVTTFEHVARLSSRFARSHALRMRDFKTLSRALGSWAIYFFVCSSTCLNLVM